ncbi:CLUMA_CG016918, isoform A [Clunio marinus]|uniref:CLUMA_CG016918, isoform A n=1 Tax=Clunio marinus TaxID=568069 RepID=A0A1J1IS38_9DIPT|nr:CLUMA_CG016918, isoform A [Clunio marinus]
MLKLWKQKQQQQQQFLLLTLRSEVNFYIIDLYRKSNQLLIVYELWKQLKLNDVPDRQHSTEAITCL